MKTITKAVAVKKTKKTKPLERALSVWKCQTCGWDVHKNFLELAQEGEPMCSACDASDIDEVMELVAVVIDGVVLKIT